MHEASALVSGASVTAAAAVWEGRAQRAVNLSGGLHHAMRDHASGFCVYDDPAVAIAWLLGAGARAGRLRRRRRPSRRRGAGGVLRRPAGADDQPARERPHPVPGHRLRVRDRHAARVPATRSTSRCRPAPATRAGCAPSKRWCRRCSPRTSRRCCVTQHGCDTHWLDPLAHLNCTVDGQRAAYRRLAELADSCAGGKWVARRRWWLRGRSGRPAGLDPPARRAHRRAGERHHADGLAAGGHRAGSAARRLATSPIARRTAWRRSLRPPSRGRARRAPRWTSRSTPPGGRFSASTACSRDGLGRGLDPEIAALRDELLEFALSLPEAWEDHPWGENVAKVRKKVFVFFGVAGRQPSGGPDREAAGVGRPCALAARKASPTGYGFGQAGWVTITLSPRSAAA